MTNELLLELDELELLLELDELELLLELDELELVLAFGGLDSEVEDSGSPSGADSGAFSGSVPPDPPLELLPVEPLELVPVDPLELEAEELAAVDPVGGGLLGAPGPVVGVTLAAVDVPLATAFGAVGESHPTRVPTPVRRNAPPESRSRNSRRPSTAGPDESSANWELFLSVVMDQPRNVARSLSPTATRRPSSVPTRLTGHAIRVGMG